MQEFSSISVSTYDPDSLTGLLNEHAAAGWSVVAIVPTGSTVTAYLSRAASDDAPDTPEAADDATTEHADEPAAAIVPEPADEPTPEPVTETTPEPAAEITPDPAAETAPAAEPTLPVVATPEPATAQPAAAQPAAAQPAAAQPAAASAAPAGWYADPSARFELRYWDGSTWTEHVSRAGQQYTDPPVA